MKTLIPSWLLSFFLLLAVTIPTAISQSRDLLLASVNGKPLTITDVRPFLPANFDSFPPEKARAVERVALENAIIHSLLSSEARRRGISVPALRRRMTVGRVNVTDARIEAEWKDNAKFFGLVSPDEAKERLRLDLESEERMKIYRLSLKRLMDAAKIIRSPSIDPRARSLREGPTKGLSEAAVSIAVFSDFRCAYCKAANVVLNQVVRDYPHDVRIVFKNLPFSSGGEPLPAIAGVCANEQGRFWEFHDAAYASESLAVERVSEIVAEIGLERTPFDKCLSSQGARQAVARDVEEARRLRITGTPTFVINGKIYAGALELAEIKRIIDGELASSLR